MGAIQKGTLKDDLQPDATGTTDASGQVTIKLSSDASLVGAIVTGEDPGRVHSPADPIPRLYAKASEGYEVVLARRSHKRASFSRRLASSASIRA